MKSLRRQISLNHSRSNIQFHLWRLSDEEYSNFRDTSIAIKKDFGFFLIMYLADRNDSKQLTLPLALVSLEQLFGLKPEPFDIRKGSFKFPLLLSLDRTSGRFFYLLDIFDHRGEIEYNFYRLLDRETDGDNTTCHEPFELEFSREEINLFIGYFKGYLIGVSARLDLHDVQPFLKSIDSSNILYGYKDKEFFIQEYESTEEYTNAQQEVLNKLGLNITINKTARNKELLESIIAE